MSHLKASKNSEHKEQQLKQLLELLADGECHSGQAMADELGVSRAYVWKLVQELQELGLELETLAGKGYCWREHSNLLDQKKLMVALKQASISCDYQLVTDSTNLQLKNNFKAGHLTVAEYQLAGRGRRGRNWQSPIATNLYWSYGWRSSLPVQQLGGLSLVVGLALISALAELGFTDLKLKWPNDIRYQAKKLAGILVELSGDAAGDLEVVIGVGLNVNMQQENQPAIEQDWISLAQIAEKNCDRQEILIAMVNKLAIYLQRFAEKGFDDFIEQWQTCDECFEQEITIFQASSKSDMPLVGRGAGIDSTGALLLATKTGVRPIHAGEVSLRINES